MSSADLLVLNKLDLVPEAAVPALEAALREIEPEAPILHAVRSRCTLGEIAHALRAVAGTYQETPIL